MEMYQIDAFTSSVFSGNPAAVLLCENWPSEQKMLAIAMENNLSETAFVVEENSRYRIRWFTPKAEVRLCGHATLAAGHMFYSHLGYRQEAIEFQSLSGILRITRTDDGYELDFPADTYIDAQEAKPVFREILGTEPIDVVKGSDDFLVRVASQDEIDNLEPDFAQLAKLDARGLLVTAPGEEFDFVSRCFFPAYGIDEDPVTGSAHTLLTPYWSKQSGKTYFHAEQRSARGGQLKCQLRGERVALEGRAVTYARAQIFV